MEEFSGLVYADRITLIFEIYRVYIKITGSDESFDRVYPMTETLLDDFDETDKYLVNAHDLFSNLASLRELSDNFSYLSEEQIKAIQKFWKTFNPGNLSEGQKTFMSIWETLPALYDELKISLLTDGLAYEGLAYRKVAESIIEGKEPLNTPFKKYLFTGFNALNRCEEELFRYLKSLGKADFFYDYDDYYVKNVHHEAGGFIRKNLKSFPPAIEIFHSNLSEEKQISFLPMSSGAGQANALPSILAEMDVSDVNSNKTAVILADEKLLIPVLYSLPASLNEVNVTMGYPVSGTSVFSLINSLGKLASGKRASPQGTNYFNFNEVLSVIKNPLLKSIIPENEAFSDLTHKSQPAWIDSEQIPGFEYKDLIFENEEIYSNPCRYLFRIFDSLIKSFQDNTDKPSVGIVNMAVLIQATELTVNLGKKINNSGIKAGPEVVFRLIKKFLGNQRVPFEGEPLAGIQVMGMLETRTLDFENIIMLSMNEGVMPKSPYNISLVPYNLRKGFGLPHLKTMMPSQHIIFIVFCKGQKKIFLLHNSTADGLSTGERSRFLHQLYYEFPIQIRERSMLFNVAQTKAREIRVEKTERVLEAMKAFTGDNSRVITPSAINEYINCPLKFYLHYITGLPGPVEKTDSLDVRVFGNILHNAMSHLYESTGSPYLQAKY
jgi:hypothetical protein